MAAAREVFVVLLRPWIMHSFICFLSLLVPKLRVTGVCWSLSLQPIGEGVAGLK